MDIMWLWLGRSKSYPWAIKHGWEIAALNGCFNGTIIERNAEGFSSKPFLITGLVGAMLRLFLSHIIPRIDWKGKFAGKHHTFWVKTKVSCNKSHSLNTSVEDCFHEMFGRANGYHKLKGSVEKWRKQQSKLYQWL